MRIKINESQYNKIKNLTENSINIDKTIQDFNKINAKLNKIYGHLMFYNLEDLIKDNSKLENHSQLLDSLDNYRHKIYMDGYDLIEKIPEDEYNSMGYNYDSVLDDKNGDISSKIEKLKNFIENLNKLSELGANMVGNFEDFKRIDV